MEKFKVFIDGEAGTTGLRIYERLSEFNDIELLSINPDLRKDPAERKKLINQADVVFLCLPDDAAKESVSLLDKDNKHTKIIDTSTAHRTNELFAYGFPELDKDLENKIKNNQLIANPGCHASGFIVAAYPLIKLGILDKNYPFAVNSITGYSGGGKKMIADYETNEDPLYKAPRLYGMGQTHKHLKEMKAIVGLDLNPIFNPIVSNFYSGMMVSTGIEVSYMKKKYTALELRDVLAQYYNKENSLVKVMPFNEKGTDSGFLSAGTLSGCDNMYLYVNGNDERICITAVYDNLGKGASGAAIQNMNLALGRNIKSGLVIKED